MAGIPTVAAVGKSPEYWSGLTGLGILCFLLQVEPLSPLELTLGAPEGALFSTYDVLVYRLRFETIVVFCCDAIN